MDVLGNGEDDLGVELIGDLSVLVQSFSGVGFSTREDNDYGGLVLEGALEDVVAQNLNGGITIAEDPSDNWSKY